jgi:hypothetical protein
MNNNEDVVVIKGRPAESYNDVWVQAATKAAIQGFLEIL